VATDATFTGDADGYKVAGNLVFETVRDILRQSASAFASNGQLSIDLSQVRNADSAGLALLIEWYRLAEKAKRPLRFTGTPKQLLALAKISDVDEVLPFN
jgi:phospholipid transport system transporter-binding protein